MKKLLLMISVISIICSGCAKFSYDITIDENDKVSIVETRGVNSPYIKVKALEKILDMDVSSSAQLSGRDSEKVIDIDNAFAGVKTTKKDLTFFNAVESLPAGFVQKKCVIKKERGLTKHSYTIDLLYDPDLAMEKANKDYDIFRMQSIIYQKYGEFLDSQKVSASQNAEIVIRIPKKASKHNATTVISDTEYKWQLSDDEPTEIILTYEYFDMFILFMILSVIVVAVGAILLNKKFNGGDPVQGL